MVVVTGNQGKPLPAAFQFQRVENLSAAERFVQNFGAQAARIVVNHVVRAQQDIHSAVLAADVTADVARPRDFAVQHPQLDFHLPPVQYLCREKHALANEVGDKAAGGSVIQIVGAVPLPDLALVHDADLVGDGESLGAGV